MKGSTMLPCRLNRNRCAAVPFAALLVAGCFLTSTAFGQSYSGPAADLHAPPDDYTLKNKFKLGAASIDVTRKSTTDWKELGLDPSKTREDTSFATFSLDLSGQDNVSLFPKSLNLTTRKTDFFGRPQFSIGSPVEQDHNELSVSDYVVSADWGAPEDRYTFSFSSRFLSDQSHNGNLVDEADEMLNFTRTMKTGGWLSSFTASIGRGYRDDADGREQSRKIGASANFKTTPKGAPHFDFTARVIQDRSTKLTPGTHDIDTKWELRTKSNILGGLTRDNLAMQPSLSIFFSVKGNSPDVEEQEVNPVDVSAGVTGKVHF